MQLLTKLAVLFWLMVQWLLLGAILHTALVFYSIGDKIMTTKQLHIACITLVFVIITFSESFVNWLFPPNCEYMDEHGGKYTDEYVLYCEMKED